jgi:hypothetical protein
MVEQPEFFIDRSLGRFTVPQELRACGLVVHTMAEVYGEQVGQDSKTRPGSATSESAAGLF